MKIVILGGGFLGVATAYFLGREGAEVIVLDRHDALAQECSFANGAQLSYSHAEPWSTHENVRKAFSWIGKKDAPLKMNLRADPEMIGWLLRFLMEANVKRTERNMLSIMRINLYSRQIMQQLVEEEDIDFHHHKNGILHLFQNAKMQKEMDKYSGFQKDKADIPYEMISREKALEYEPALRNMKQPVHSAMVYPIDESGSMIEFTQGLAQIAKERYGVKFSLETEIEEIFHKDTKIHGVKTNRGVIKAEHYVMAMGAYSRIALKKLGIDLPIYPMKGYSVTVPVLDPAKAPKMSVTDAAKKIVVTRLGNQLRAAGTAEFAGFNHAFDPRRTQMLTQAIATLFPGAANIHDATPWACLRPSTPDNVPIIGGVQKYDNLWLNTGHGTLGWTQGAGSAKLLSDMMIGNPPEIAITGLTAERYRA